MFQPASHHRLRPIDSHGNISTVDMLEPAVTHELQNAFAKRMDESAKLDSVAFCSPAKSLTLSGLIEAH